MAAPISTGTPVPRRPVQSASSGSRLQPDRIDLGCLAGTSFLCEGEDALLTGMTRSPIRRLLALNVPGTAPVPVARASARQHASARVA